MLTIRLNPTARYVVFSIYLMCTLVLTGHDPQVGVFIQYVSLSLNALGMSA